MAKLQNLITKFDNKERKMAICEKYLKHMKKKG